MVELGLSLGDCNSTTTTTSKQPFGFLQAKPPSSDQIINNTSSTTSKSCLGFRMALGINSTKTPEDDDDSTDDDDDDGQDSSQESTKDKNKALDLLPLAPLHRLPLSHQPSFPWSSGSSEGGSSGNVPAARGFDVNRLQTVAAAEEVSSPNSETTPSFRMDFGMYRGGNGGGGNKRQLEIGCGNDAVEGASFSRGSDDDENGLTRKKLRLSKEQSAFLEESFKEHNTLNPKQKLALAKQLNLRPRQVEVWFQNRRARTKLKQTEVDCEYLKRCCETLTEENRKLHKELQELRALKTKTPFYMQSPATTLTMCPSCERVATTSTTTTPQTTTTIATALKPIDSTFNSKITTSTSTATPLPFPLSARPKFYPFTSPPTTHPHQSAAS